MDKILIVEDEKPIAELIKLSLMTVGYDCDYALDGAKGADLFERNNYDLVLLDIMLPEVNGYELLNYIKPNNTPVIFITAKAQLSDRVFGLNLGADDYIVKPFEVDELIARVEAVLRRYQKGKSDYKIQDVTVYLKQHKVTKNNQIIELTRQEYNLLVYLIKNKNIVLQREIIYEKIWHDEMGSYSRTLDLHIQRLRKKLDWKDIIKTIHRIGYMLEWQE